MKKNNLIKMLNLLKNEKWLLIIQCCIGFIESVLSISLVLLIAKLTDLVSNHNYEGFIEILPVSFFTITLKMISYYYGKFLGIKCKAQFSSDIKNLIYTRIIHISLSIKEKYQSGFILSVFNNQIELIQDFIGGIPGIVINPIIALIAAICFANISYKLLIISCVLIPISSILYNYLSKPIQKKTKEIMSQKSGLNIIAKDIMGGFYIMKAFGLQKYFSNIYSSKVDYLARKEKEKDQINSTLGRIFIILRYIPQLIIPLYGGYLSYKHEITLGQLIAANSIIWYIILPIEELLNMKKKIHSIKPALEDIYDIIKLEHEINDLVLYDAVSMEGKGVDIHNLNFAYKEGVNVLKGITLKLEKNEHIKIVGQSGAGKSTLVKIICGLYTDFRGTVKIKGMELTPQNAIEIRKLISYVPQHPYIFQETIAENISMGKNVSRETIIKAAKLADADAFIQAMPFGYDTWAGNGGVKLSGGQCKRLAIARAIIKDGALFIFDEPTSALDLQSEQKVSQGFDEACKRKCSIVITHRMELVKEKEKVKLLSEGNLYEK